MPFDLDHPWWLVDPDFDLEFHVRHIALPQPGDWRQLCIQAARLHARELDLGWAIASRLQERASHLVLLGSPAPAVVAMMRTSSGPPSMAVGAQPVVQAGQRALRLLDPDCTVPACGCSYIDDLRRDLSPATTVLSIRSRDDQIVPPGASEVRRGGNAVVGGTHSGLVYNRAVYPLLAGFLAGTG